MTTDNITITPKEGGSGAWSELDPGAYRAVVDGIEDVGISDVFPADGPRLKFTFALLDENDENGAPITLFKWCSQKLTTGNKQSNLWKWATALGVTPVIGQPFAVSALKDRECQVVIAMKAGQDGQERPAIESILPPQKAAGRRAAAPAAAPPDDVCVVCDAPVEFYTTTGKPVCAKHNG